MRLAVALVLGLSIAWPAIPASAQAPAVGPGYDMVFPEGWIVEYANEVSSEGSFEVALRAYPEDRTEECRLADLSEIAAGLHALGIEDARTLNYAAGELLGRGASYATSGLGYNDPWSAYGKGPIAEGQPFALYSYVGRDAWPGLEHAWLVLECWSDASFHQDWEQIARTFEFAIPQSTLDSTGPVVIGGAIEVPSVDLALELAEGWVAADLTHPDIASVLGSMGPEGDWFALQLEHGVGDGIAQQAESGETVALWAWAADHGPAWPEHCDLTVKEPDWDSAADHAEVAAAYIEKEDRAELDSSMLIELPAGKASRFDYRWSPTSGGSDFILIERGRQIVLACSDFGFGDAQDVAAKRDRWLAMAESLRFLSPPDGGLAARG